MNESIRVSGKTVNDAIMNAAIALNTTSDHIEYTVIEKESKGFLGIGAKDAVIEAKVKEEAPEKPAESADEEASASANVTPTASQTAKEEAPSTASQKAKEKAPETSREVSKAAFKAASDETAEASADAPAAAAKAPKKARREESYEERRERRNADIRVLDDPSEAIERAETFLKDVFASMGMSVEINSTYDGECLNVSMEGDEMGLLIGKRGQTLDSLQYLTSLVVNKGKAYYVRVKLDTENYRDRRKATLENLAKNIAVKVKKTRQTVYLEPMNPYERRIIHSALQDDPFVTTHSEGEEPDRKVVVTLKKDADLDALERKYGERSRRYGRGGYGRGGRGGRGYGRGGQGYGRRDDHREDSREDRREDRRPAEGNNGGEE